MLQVMAVLGAGLAKISVCLLVLRVVDKAAVNFTRFLWALIVFVFVVHLAGIIVVLIQCIPTEYIWNPNITGRCLFGPIIKFDLLYSANSKVVKASG